MPASADALFTIADGVVVELDPADLSVVSTYDPPGADWLNDVAATSDGQHFVVSTASAAYSFTRGDGDVVATWPYRVGNLVGGDASDIYGIDWGMLLRLQDVGQSRNAATLAVQQPAGP